MGAVVASPATTPCEGPLPRLLPCNHNSLRYSFLCRIRPVVGLAFFLGTLARHVLSSDICSIFLSTWPIVAIRYALLIQFLPVGIAVSIRPILLLCR